VCCGIGVLFIVRLKYGSSRTRKVKVKSLYRYRSILIPVHVPQLVCLSIDFDTGARASARVRSDRDNDGYD
jgi:hypothetical protein